MNSLKEFTCEICGEKFRRKFIKVPQCVNCQRQLKRKYPFSKIRPNEKNDRNKLIVADRVVECMTYQELAEKHNISKQRIGQILSDYGAMDTKFRVKKKLGDRIYRFIIQYKKKYDGNSPGIRRIMDGCDISVMSRYNIGMKYLLETGKIIIDKNQTPHQIIVKGAKWTSPKS